ncbi:MSMEG_1198 family transcriptional regulator [Gordonia bronchialis]|uniref:response regulator n=1 Tax=Gordonia bronchialis TaxID=2054 RepID=UPI00226ED303|nr:response regulator [Gordonia bronchialis]
MPNGMRVLVASPLGKVIATPLTEAVEDIAVVVAEGEAEFIRCVAGKVRFDVVITDLIWNRPDGDWSFDGLDAIDVLRDADRVAPVLLATQGHSMELEHLEEARTRDEVRGIVDKSDGFGAIARAVQRAALGERAPIDVPRINVHPLCGQFVGQRGTTAGRLAGAIASGTASDNASLAVAAHVSPNTANKVTSHYLGPIISRRGEHDPNLALTQAAIYRWCGLHARYIVSWCRRHGHGDVLTP